MAIIYYPFLFVFNSSTLIGITALSQWTEGSEQFFSPAVWNGIFFKQEVSTLEIPNSGPGSSALLGSVLNSSTVESSLWMCKAWRKGRWHVHSQRELSFPLFPLSNSGINQQNMRTLEFICSIERRATPNCKNVGSHLQPQECSVFILLFCNLVLT